MTLMHLVTVSAFYKRGKCFSVLYSNASLSLYRVFITEQDQKVQEYDSFTHDDDDIIVNSNKILTICLTDSSCFVKHPYFTWTMT